MRSRVYTAGYSLVEAMVYIAILVLASSAAVTALLSYSDVIADQQAKRLITSSAQSILERVTREVRSADEIDVLGSTLDTTTGVLVVENTGGSDVTFALNGGTVTVTDGNGTSALTGDVQVDALTFHHYTTGNTELVRTMVTVSATSSDRTATETFYGAAVLRGSYD